jgi:hypothetical protein
MMLSQRSSRGARFVQSNSIEKSGAGYVSSVGGAVLILDRRGTLCDGSPRNWRNIAGLVCAAILLSNCFYWALTPFELSYPGASLDDSWMVVVGEEAARAAQWGKDIVFTYGPTSSLSTNYYNELFLYLNVLGGLLISIIFGVATSLFLVGRPKGHTILFTAVVAFAACLFTMRDPLFFALAMIIFLVSFQGGEVRRLGELAAIAGAIALGPVALSKMTFGLSALFLLVLADFNSVFARRMPLLTFAFVLSATLTSVSLGQSLSVLPLFLELQGEIVKGYSEAMALNGWDAELITYLVVSGLLGALILKAELNREVPRPNVELVLLLLGFSAFWLLTFKAGFVRHDLHTLTAWQAAGFGAILYAVSLPWSRGRKKASPAWVMVIGVTLLVVIAPMRWAFEPGGPWGFPGITYLDRLSAVYRDVLVRAPTGHWSSLFAFVSHPSDWLIQADVEKANAWARIRESQPLPKLVGSIDVIPSVQATVIANGLDYRPRPVFAEYSTYTPRLIEANRQFFESARAPEWLFFAPGSIDGRYPSSAEGALWPDFLRLYEPQKFVGDLLLLHRRAQPLSGLLGASRRVHARVGEEISIADTGPLFAKIVIKKTWLGRLLNLLYRPPEVMMLVKCSDKREAQYRLVPQMAESGFVLSPLVNNIRTYVALAYGFEKALEPNWVESIRIVWDRVGRLAYVSEVEIELIPVLIQGKWQDTSNDLAPEVESLTRTMREWKP